MVYGNIPDTNGTLILCTVHITKYGLWIIRNCRYELNIFKTRTREGLYINWFLKLLNFSQSARCVLFQYPSNTSRNVFKPTQLSPSLGYISKMIVVWWLVAGGPNGDGSCVRLLSPCHQCVCSWSHPFLANASVPVPILTLTLAGG